MRLQSQMADVVVSRDTLYRLEFGNVTVYIPEIPGSPIEELLTGRDTVGWERRSQYKRALTCALRTCWGRIAEREKFHTTIPVASLLRGGEYIRPENLPALMPDHHIFHVGLRVERYQDEDGKWQAEVDRTACFDLHLLRGVKENAALDECKASGRSARKAALVIKEENPDMERFIFICPISSDAGLRELMALPFPVILFTFGIFKVMPEGWKKTYTDIVVTAPDGPDSEDPFVVIPDSVWKCCWEKYGSLEGYRGICLAGDASRNNSDNKREQVTDLIETGHESVVWNRTLPTHKLWVGLRDRVCGVPFHSSKQAIAWQKEMERIAVEGVAGITDRAVCGRHFDDLEGLWRGIMARNGK